MMMRPILNGKVMGVATAVILAMGLNDAGRFLGAAPTTRTESVLPAPSEEPNADGKTNDSVAGRLLAAAALPEPTSLALLGLGGMSILAVGSRRKTA